MTRTNTVRLRVEELESRSTPASLSGLASSFSEILQADDVPQHVALAAVVVIALSVGWDHRTRAHIQYPSLAR